MRRIFKKRNANKKILIILCALALCASTAVIFFLTRRPQKAPPAGEAVSLETDAGGGAEPETDPDPASDAEPETDSDLISEPETDSDLTLEPETDSGAGGAKAGEGAQNPFSPVRAVYQTANRAGDAGYMAPLIELCEQTELNAIVIDVKNDLGLVTFQREIPAAEEYGVSAGYISNVRGLLETLKNSGIYPIARVVAFKDDALTEARPDFYIKDASGAFYRDNSAAKSAWLNPYNKEVWEYLTDIAVSAVELGFMEVQFDYIRFDTSSRLNDCDFGDTGGLSRTDAITAFAAFAAEKIRAAGGFISADVYGTVISSSLDAGIVGQDYAALAGLLDCICPMIYPSHYADGSFGVEHPDTEPYKIIRSALTKSNEALGGAEGGAVVRPYLQGFTASYLANYIEYTPEVINEQIKAVYDCGLTEWLIWNASGNYDPGIFAR